MAGKNPIDLDLVNINTFIKFGQIFSICSKDVELKRNSDKSRAITLLKISHN